MQEKNEKMEKIFSKSETIENIKYFLKIIMRVNIAVILNKVPK